MSDQIEWVEAPVSSRTDWAETLSPLVERPGQWAIVRRKPTPGSAYSTANNLRSGAIRNVPPGDWEFKGELDPETGEGVIKACYLGPKKPARRK